MDIRRKAIGGKQVIMVDDLTIPLEFDGQKMFFSVQKPMPIELEALSVYELTSPQQFQPEHIASRNNHLKPEKIPASELE